MNKLAAGLIAGIAIIAICLSVYTHLKLPKIAYIELQKVYEDFQMKKELENELGKINASKQNQLDSMRFQLELFSRTIKNKGEIHDDFELKKRSYLLKEQQIKENMELVSGEYNDRIWKQLNQYIGDYGKENNIVFLLGASGSGTLMYADENTNVTKEVSEYVNKKYSGKKN